MMNSRILILGFVCVFLFGCAPNPAGKLEVASTLPEQKVTSLPTISLTSQPIPTAIHDEDSSAVKNAILFSEDFEDGSADGLFEISKVPWSIRTEDSGNKVYCNDDPGFDPGFMFGAYEWNDYAIQIRVKGVELNDDPVVSLYSRFERYKWLMYYGFLNLTTGSAGFAYNDPYDQFGAREVAVPTDGWFTLKQKTYGSRMAFYVNEQLIAKGEDDHRPDGKAGFLANPYLKVCIDDIRVWEIDNNGDPLDRQMETEPIILSVSERLANHRFPKLFYQNQDNNPTAEAFAPAQYYDILTFGQEVSRSNWIYLGPEGIIRSKNPNAVILATFSVQEFFQKDNSWTGGDFVSRLKPEWIMRDIYGEPFPSFCCYDGDWSIMMNLGTDVRKFIPDFINTTSQQSGQFDGIFYDGTNETWANRSRRPIDIDNDGLEDPGKKVDQIMNDGLRDLLAETRAVFPPDTLITGNGVWRGMTNITEEKTDTVLAGLLNGRMIEGFLNWEKKRGQDWKISMRTYFLMQQVSMEPKTPFIMAYCTGNDYDHLRYVLASSLMLDGYFTCTNHQDGAGAAPYSANWWYDEYSVNLASGKAIKSLDAKGYLGMPIDDAYNALDKSELLSTLLVNNDQHTNWITWRRDFQNGIVLVNPSEGSMKIDLNGTYRKIAGYIDPLFNDGSLVTEITLKPKSGIILLNTQ